MTDYSNSMQTFLPLPSFEDSLRTLDYRRLGKQRVEAMQILLCILGRTPQGWANHPATRMWKPYPQALASYGLWACQIWIELGYRDSCSETFEAYLATCPDWDDSRYPVWFGREDFHSSHRAALLAKDPVHYGQFGWSESPEINYVWPSKQPEWVVFTQD